ncbi:MAG: redoxin domain-containing protein [Planctomycetales bacterium]|nr:redoxin domain-containing protein [Planctomycetales bacterium]
MKCNNELPMWVPTVLGLAAIYNLAWGVWVVAAPQTLFAWAGMSPLQYPSIWQCVGMIVGVYGVGYAIAATNPYRHWPIVLVGLLGKICGPIGFVAAAMQGDLPWRFGATLITNDLIWWLPFGVILYFAFRFNSDTSRQAEPLCLQKALNEPRSQRGATLAELSQRQPTLVVFLRHGGCTFCRQTLADLGEQRRALEAEGVTLAIVHMGRPMDGTMMLQRYGLECIHQFSDPHCLIYKAFGLERGRLSQLISTTVVKRAIPAFLAGHGVGKLAGDGFRMPGVFVLVDGQIRVTHTAATAAERPDYLQIVQELDCELVHA